jgi:holo-[acyl-carrier protein] synthase
MIIGIGNDIISIKKIRNVIKYKQNKFINRIFTPLEKIYIYRKYSQECSCAKRFSAKESFFKAIGTGKSISIRWKNIQIVNNKSGSPKIYINPRLSKIISDICCVEDKKLAYHISISDTEKYANTYVLIEAK